MCFCHAVRLEDLFGFRWRTCRTEYTSSACPQVAMPNTDTATSVASTFSVNEEQPTKQDNSCNSDPSAELLRTSRASPLNGERHATVAVRALCHLLSPKTRRRISAHPFPTQTDLRPLGHGPAPLPRHWCLRHSVTAQASEFRLPGFRRVHEFGRPGVRPGAGMCRNLARGCPRLRLSASLGKYVYFILRDVPLL